MRRRRCRTTNRGAFPDAGDAPFRVVKPSLGASVHALKILGSGAKPQSPQAIRRSLSCGTLRRILRPQQTQTTTKAWKKHPNIYDDNLVKCHDDNSAINTYNSVRNRKVQGQVRAAAQPPPRPGRLPRRRAHPAARHEHHRGVPPPPSTRSRKTSQGA